MDYGLLGCLMKFQAEGCDLHLPDLLSQRLKPRSSGTCDISLFWATRRLEHIKFWFFKFFMSPLSYAEICNSQLLSISGTVYPFFPYHSHWHFVISLFFLVILKLWLYTDLELTGRDWPWRVSRPMCGLENLSYLRSKVVEIHSLFLLYQDQ